MIIMTRKPVPLYEAECPECGSIIRYTAAEVALFGYITCPVCGTKFTGSISFPVDYAIDEEGRQ